MWQITCYDFLRGIKKKGKERIENKTKGIQNSYLNIGFDFVCFTFIGMVGHTLIVVIISYNKTTRK